MDPQHRPNLMVAHHEGLRPHPEERRLRRVSKDEVIEVENALCMSDLVRNGHCQSPGRLICPTGSLLILVSSPLQKNSASPQTRGELFILLRYQDGFGQRSANEFLERNWLAE